MSKEIEVITLKKNYIKRATQELDKYNAIRWEAATSLRYDPTLLYICELLSALDEKEKDYQRIIGEILLCNPIPACNRPDDQLEPPWEVIARIRKELEKEKERVKELEKQYKLLQWAEEIEHNEKIKLETRLNNLREAVRKWFDTVYLSTGGNLANNYRMELMEEEDKELYKALEEVRKEGK